MRSNDWLKRKALSIFEAGLRAADPYRAVTRQVIRQDRRLSIRTGKDRVETFDLDDLEKIVVVGAGKAAAPMARALGDLLGDRISDGVIVVKTGHTTDLGRVRTFEAAHPVPDQAGVRGTAEILSALEGLGERSLVLTLISGGGSALLPQPAEGVSLQDKQQMTDRLLATGAGIQEINALRKHVSAVKGGNLARRAYPATVVSLILSDVVGDPLDVIASGPTVPDPSSFADAGRVLDRYRLWDLVPASVADRIRRGLRGEIPETPKPGDPVFGRCHPVLLGSNRLSLEACVESAQAAGFNTRLLSSRIEGETREVARRHAALALEIRRSGVPVHPPACLVSGGETTVTLKGDGLGGRNQEFALAAALEIRGQDGLAVFSAGTDGTDGPTDAAGAIAFGDTLERAGRAGLDPVDSLEHNDSYHFFEAIGDLVKTGPTNTNVMDIHLVLVQSREEAACKTSSGGN